MSCDYGVKPNLKKVAVWQKFVKFDVETIRQRCCNVMVQRAGHYYSTLTACEVCSVTPRMLDYWILTKVIEPTRVYECDYEGRGEMRRRAYHLYDFDGLLRIKLVKDLRDAGISLQRIRFAMQKLRRMRGEGWQTAWILTDGKNLFHPTDNPDSLVSLMKKEKGQLVFSVIAVETASKHVTSRLKRFDPFPHQRYNGRLVAWGKATRSA